MPFFDAQLIATLALELSHKSKVSQDESLQFFQNYGEILQKLSPQHFEELKNSAASLLQWGIAVELLQVPHISNPITKTDWDSFIGSVDASDHNLTQWLLAIEKVAQWSLSRGIKSNYSKMIGYVHCCAESIQGKDYPLQLKDIVSEMLEGFGFTG